MVSYNPPPFHSEDLAMASKSILCALLVGCTVLSGYQGPAQETGNQPDKKKAGVSDSSKAKAGVSGPGKDFGFTEAFEAEVKKVGEISADKFARRHAPKANYLKKISWDPTKAKFWDQFALDPSAPGAEINARGYEAWNLLLNKTSGINNLSRPEINRLKAKKPAKGAFDFRLKGKELELFKHNGFVVSERLGSHSFTDLYHRIYVRDLPVFITTDSMLHAWHRTFDRMLEGLEMDYFFPSAAKMLSQMAEQLPAAKKAYGNNILAESLADVDFFLAVAQHLLHNSQAAPTVLGQQKRIELALKACASEKMLHYPLFGRQREIDFSQFKPRGRYDQHDWSKNYFRAMMWLGRIDFRIAGGPSKDQDLRELAGAIVLNDLLQRAKQQETWQQFDRLLQHFVGRTDSLNFTQLGKVLAAIGAPKAADITPQTLAALHTHIQNGKIGEQHIRGEWFCVDPNDPKKFVLPRSFTFMGQRFILDSWVLSKVVYDDIIWKKEKIERRIPSCLDMSFAVFGNDHVVPLLHERMKNRSGREFRDGLPYQHNLSAARNLVDRLPPATWKDSIYTDWLGCLRELSKPTTDKKYPESVRTSAWAMKATTTQLASWTQLRHDTVLYAKPSYTSGESCFYPAGFVEPVPHFWKRFEQMVLHTRDFVEKTPFPNGKAHQAVHLMHLNNFAKAATMLRSIAEKQDQQKALSKEETHFMEEVVVLGGVCGGPRLNGWYPNLFSNRSAREKDDDAHKWVALVTDVHTDPPSQVVGDPGCVIHQGVGNVDLLVIAVDNGKDKMVYAGPVFSHYEFETPNAVRKTNGDWHNMLRSGKMPPRPEWTRGYLAPGVNPDAKSYGK
jgi:hypothetical protein